jgi:hypothetical protein
MDPTPRAMDGNMAVVLVSVWRIDTALAVWLIAKVKKGVGADAG